MKQHHGQTTNILIKDKAYKRPFDLRILLIGHVLLSPLRLLIWTLIPIAIWLEDRGLVFYRQRRALEDGWVFIVHHRQTISPRERILQLQLDLRQPKHRFDGPITTPVRGSCER